MSDDHSRANSEGMPGFFVRCWAIVRSNEIKHGEIPTRVITGGLVYQRVTGQKKKMKWDAKIFVPSGWLMMIMGREQMFSRLTIEGVVDEPTFKRLAKIFDNANTLPVPGGSVVKYRIPKSLTSAGRMLMREIKNGR